MIVVSDTTAIINLAIIGELHLLPDLFETILIPRAVYQEVVVRGANMPGAETVERATWIQQKTPQNQSLVEQLRADLDPGEAEAIALAIEQQADLLVIDERKGREVAKHHQLPIIGLLGILTIAKRRGLIPAVKPLVDRLVEEADFYVSEKLLATVLASVQE